MSTQLAELVPNISEYVKGRWSESWCCPDMRIPEHVYARIFGALVALPVSDQSSLPSEAAKSNGMTAQDAVGFADCYLSQSYAMGKPVDVTLISSNQLRVNGGSLADFRFARTGQLEFRVWWSS